MTELYAGESKPWRDAEWLVVCGAVFSFATAWSIGANDVANAFGTTVGAKTITLWQACLIASIFEFAGAVGLGNQVTKTVSGSVTSPEYFASAPDVFAFGMLCALMAAWMWLTLATYLELAVSTTHSIIGAIMGFGLVYGGRKAIIWNQRIDEFPYTKGLLPIVLSWFTSPVCAGLAAAGFFLANRTLILRRRRSNVYAFWALPILVFVTIFVNTFFVLYKGAADVYNWQPSDCVWVAVVVAAGCTCIAVPVTYILKKRHDKMLYQRRSPVDVLPELAKDSSDWNHLAEPVGFWAKVKARLFYSVTVDVYEDVHRDTRVAAMHSAAEVFDPRAEEVFKYLQVFSSCCVSFAHGANDVANAVGPFAAIWYVYNNIAVPQGDLSVPRWILVLGGAGIVVGLATYGYNIIKVLGVKMCKITPSRGYCAELAVAFTVSVSSVYGLPISTTHCIVGAEAGVGMVEGVTTGTNWTLIAKTVCAWGTTLVMAGGLSAALFAFGAYSPALGQLNTITDYEQLILTTATTSIKQLNNTNYGNLATLGRFDVSLNKTLSDLSLSLTRLFSEGVVNDTYLINLASTVSQLYGSLSVPTVGFNKTAASNSSQAITVPFQ